MIEVCINTIWHTLTFVVIYIYINIIVQPQVRKTLLRTMSSSFQPHFNPVEEEGSKSAGNTITLSPRKKRKKFVDTTKKLSNTNSMYGAICKMGFALLFCEAGNPATARNYKNPGSRRKAWCMQFDKGKSIYIVDSFVYNALLNI